MKSSLLLSGVLLLSAPVFALAQAPTGPVASEPSGYELLAQAGKAILPGPNGGPSAPQKLPPAENLKNERLAVARNAPALVLVRRALQKPIEIPEVGLGDGDMKFNGNVRELARQFWQESDVRFADGDFGGAMNSRLDAMEMGAATGHGFIISLLVGVAVEAIGSKDADKIAAKLDAAQCREAIARLNKIEARRTTVAEALRHEQKYSLGEMLKLLGDTNAVENLQPGEDGEFPTANDIYALKALTPELLTTNNARLFGAAIEASQMPYAQGVKAELPQDLDMFTKMALTYLEGGRYRFGYDRTVTETRLLRAALELRAQKLETGSYPEKFVAPIDPFAAGAKPLVYRKTGKEYLLYSVGPDGKDDGGAELQSLEKHPESGLTVVSERVLPTSTGDIVRLPL